MSVLRAQKLAVPLLFVLCACASQSRHHSRPTGSILDGIYLLKDVRCPKPADLDYKGRVAAGVVKDDNALYSIEFSDGKIISRNKVYKFDHYRQDHCVITTIRDFTIQGDTVSVSPPVTREFAAHGAYGQIACDTFSSPREEPSFKFKLLNGELEVVFDEPSPNTTGYCKAGRPSFAYQRQTSREFPVTVRPELGETEIDLLQEVKKHPQSAEALQNYVYFLLVDRRVAEAEPLNRRLLNLMPPSPYAATFAQWISEYESQNGGVERERTLGKHLVEFMKRPSKSKQGR